MPQRGFCTNSFSAEFPAQGAGARGLQADNLVDIFRARAVAHPERIAFTFLTHDECHSAADRTYAELDRQARATAARLQQTCRPGDRALLMFDSGLDYIAALAGCLYAGVVAVPVFPPDPLRVNRILPRLEAIVADARATVLLGTTSDLAWAGAMLGQIPGLRELIPSDTIDIALAEQWHAPLLDRRTPAFLQYTSGSTGTPKGVLVRHGNVLANLGQMEEALDIDDAIACTWLPAYHDMGLVGGVFQCWYSGRRNVMLSPLSFFQQPLRWLQAVSSYRATTLAAPDFAYDLCVRKIRPEERSGLDLSCVRVALSGAEPVRAATIDRFVAAFADCGMRREAFCPCYGMAEATLLIAAAGINERPTVRSFDSAEMSRNRAVESCDSENVRTLTSCGRTPPGQQMAIVDPQTLAELPPGLIGEIWVAGANVATEYWGQPAESAATFQAFTTTGAGPFLRTGDMGFLHAGELYISGRRKDLIIVNGRNYHPQDIEQTVEAAHSGIKARGGAAFACEEEGRERLIVVQEVSRPKKTDTDEVVQAIRRAVLVEHGLNVDGVVLLRPGTVPKTTSGKIQRHACLLAYQRGELDVVYSWQAAIMPPTASSYVAPRNELEAQLADLWSEVLGVSPIGVFDNFLDLGGSSLLATQLVSRLGPRLGIELPLAEVFDRPTIASLAELINMRRQAEEIADEGLIEYLNSLSDTEVELLLARSDAGHPTLPLQRSVHPLAGATNFASLTTDAGGAHISRAPQH